MSSTKFKKIRDKFAKKNKFLKNRKWRQRGRTCCETTAVIQHNNSSQFATLETSGSLGRVLFRKVFWDRYRGQDYSSFVL